MTTEFSKQLPEKTESKKEFEINYKPFDPKAELEKLKKDHKETRPDRLEEYKKELIKQKQGIAEIQVSLEEQIRENPEISRTELMKTVLAKAPEYRLSENQLNLFGKTLDKYVEKHQAVRRARKEYPNDKELFEACFGKKPKGVIEVIEDPVTLYFRCHNLKDYAWVHQQKFFKPENEQKLTRDDIKKAERSGGSLIPMCLLFYLFNAVTVEKAKGRPSDSDTTEKIFKHEEQHNIEKLFREQRTAPQAVKNLEQLTAYLKILRKEKLERQAKDEILAYCKQGRDTSETLSSLLKPASKGGIYDYFDQIKGALEENIKDELTPEIFEKNKKTIEKIFKEVLVDKYKQEITKAISAVEELEKMGKNKNEIISLLITEPLSQWEKLVKRIKEVKK